MVSAAGTGYYYCSGKAVRDNTKTDGHGSVRVRADSQSQTKSDMHHGVGCSNL